MRRVAPLSVSVAALLLSYGSRLQAQQAIERVNVTAAPVPGYLRDFDERRRLGIGRFLDTTDIAPYADRHLSTLLGAKVPGLRQIRYGGRTALASSRGSASFEKVPSGDQTDRTLGAPKACYVQVIIDRVAVYQGQLDEPLFNPDNLNPRGIVALEFFTVSNRPSEFKIAGGGPCGTLVLWTRR